MQTEFDEKKYSTLKQHLDDAVAYFQKPSFIDSDPIQIPHRFSLKQDIEIAAFIAAIFAWGQRKTIISKASEFIQLMDNQPYAFVLNHSEHDLKAFEQFRHRTFQGTDALFIIDLLKRIYHEYDSMESVFFSPESDGNIKAAISRFHRYAFAPDYAPVRTKKHLATPERNSTCKRINMFLRWMVRSPQQGIDFGIWVSTSSAQLMIPLDVHVEKIARSLGLLKRKQRDWNAVEEVTEELRKFDPMDPVKYDFALFGLGVLSAKDALL
jgi:uncharacterized protein (TIGR02757 family)